MEYQILNLELPLKQKTPERVFFNLNFNVISIRFENKHVAYELKQQKYSYLSTQSTKWTDSLFPPDDTSLYSKNSDFYKSTENLNVCIN